MKSFDSLFAGGCKPQPHSCGCETLKGNSVEVQLQKDDCEVRADIVVGKTKSVRLWGQVKGCDGSPVSYALVKLVRVVYHCGNIEYEGIAHTITDCNGFYQFDVNCCEVGTKYRILVHKAAVGNERIVPSSAQQCDPCDTPIPPCPPVPPCPCND